MDELWMVYERCKDGVSVQISPSRAWVAEGSIDRLIDGPSQRRYFTTRLRAPKSTRLSEHGIHNPTWTRLTRHDMN